MTDPARSITTAGPTTWACSVADPATLVCTATTFTPAAVSDIYLPVKVGQTAMLGGAPAATVTALGISAVNVESSATIVATGLGTRFLASGSLEVRQAGAGVLSCDAAIIGCLEARRREGPESKLNNNSWSMMAMDGANLSLASSAAQLDLGSYSNIRFAGLYWSADLSTGGTESEYAQVILKPPATSPLAITAQLLEVTATRYFAFAEVTAHVSDFGSGIWALGGMSVGTGPNTAAGWSLVVVVEDQSLEASRVAVFDGLQVISGATPAEFSLPAKNGGQAVVGAVVWEGDAGISGDKVTLDGLPLTRAVSGSSDNVFASWADGAIPFCADLDDPLCLAETNTFGFDTGLFAPAPVAGNRAEVGILAGSDSLILGALTLLTR